MTTAQRQYALLATLVVVFAAVLWWGVLGGGDPAETGAQPSNITGRATAVAGRGGTRAAALPVEDVALERLKPGGEPMPQTQRNPFRFRPKPPPPRAVTQRTAEPVGPPVPPGPPPPPPIPPIALKYIGFADGAGARGRIGVFADGRGTVINANEGDILEGRYRVLRLGTDSADLGYVDGRGRQTIRLSGQ